MRTLPLLALVPLLALACSPEPPAQGQRIVYEVAPEHAAAVVEVLQARLGPSTTVSEAEPGHLHVDIRMDDDEALVRRVAQMPGRLRFLIVAGGGDEPAGGMEAAHGALEAWCGEHPSRPVSEAPGPAEGFVWAARAEAATDAPIAQRAVLLLEPRKTEWRFETPQLASVQAGRDNYGFPAIGLELGPDRQADFGAFTEEHSKRLLAVVVDGEALTIATINEPLPGRYQITGGQRGFTEEEVAVYVPVLRHGMLPAPVKYVETRAFP